MRRFPRPFVLCTSLVASLMVAVLASAGGANAGILKRLDYESGRLNQWSSVQALPGRITVVRSPRRQGHYSARFVVRPGDTPVPGGERSELTYQAHERAGVSSWWRWSTYFPASFNPVKGNWNVFTQWHHSGLWCPPPIRFIVDAYSRPAKMFLVVRGGKLNTASCTATSRHQFRIGTLRLGHWYRFMFHVRWSPHRSGGVVRLVVNGRVKVPRRHMATLYAGQSVYIKQGFYRAPSGRTSVVYHDGLQRFRP
jgi:hypothetical protein